MLKNFDQSLKTIEGKKAKQLEARSKEDAALEQLRRKERELASSHGGLIANKRVSANHRRRMVLSLRKQSHERHVKERESAVKEAAKSWNMAGYDYSPLEESKIATFVERLQEMVRKAESDMKRLQVR